MNLLRRRACMHIPRCLLYLGKQAKAHTIRDSSHVQHSTARFLLWTANQEHNPELPDIFRFAAVVNSDALPTAVLEHYRKSWCCAHRLDKSARDIMNPVHCTVTPVFWRTYRPVCWSDCEPGTIASWLRASRHRRVVIRLLLQQLAMTTVSAAAL